MESFEAHPFCNKLKNEYIFAFDRTHRLRFTLLVPPLCDVIGLNDLTSTMDSHLIRTDPVGNRYATISGKWVMIDMHRVMTEDGFDSQNMAIILQESTYYNERKHSIRLVFIDTAIYLPSEAVRYSLLNMQETVFRMFPSDPNLEFYRKFLEMFHENEPVISQMKQYVADFNENYIMVQGCESQVWKRVKSIWVDTTESLVNQNPAFSCCRRHAVYMNELQMVVESYLLDEVYDVIHGGLLLIHGKDDDYMHRKCTALADTSLEELGLPKVFVCDLSPAIAIMKEMPQTRTPIDMLQSMQQMIKTVTLLITTQADTTAAQRDEPLPITTDDLLCCISFVIIKACPKHIHADLDYMQNFRFSNTNTGELGFNLVTFHAAVSFIQTEIEVPGLVIDTEPPTDQVSPILDSGLKEAPGYTDENETEHLNYPSSCGSNEGDVKSDSGNPAKLSMCALWEKQMQFYDDVSLHVLESGFLADNHFDVTNPNLDWKLPYEISPFNRRTSGSRS